MINFTANTIQCHIAKFCSESNDYKFLLLQRAADLEVYPNIWQVITGTIDEGETAVECLYREVYEEISINLMKYDVYTVPYICKYFMPAKNAIGLAPVFGAVIDESDPVIISGEHQAYSWLSSNEYNEQFLVPSQIEAHSIFEKYILHSQNKEVFKIKHEL